MTRDDAAEFLSEQWSDLAATFGIGAFDSAVAGWKAAIDAALRALGVARVDLQAAVVGIPQEATFEALLRYYGARLLYAQAANKVDIAITGRPGVSKTNSQLAARLETLIKTYTDELAIYGVTVGPQMTMGRLSLDFLEPASLEFGQGDVL